MPHLIEIKSDTFPSLYNAFLHDDDPFSSEQDWRNIFDYQWPHEESCKGYAMLDGDKIVGMMAMAFSDRLVDGEKQKFCNLHTWWVHEKYRGHSLLMLKPILNLKNYTITHFTPCDRVRALLKRLGFVDLNLQMKILLPPNYSSVASQMKNLVMDFDQDIKMDEIHPEELRILKDHLSFRVNSLLITEIGENCLVVYTNVERYRVRYCHIQYVGNRELFANKELAIRSALMKRHGVKFVVLDKRLYPGMNFKRSFDFWAPGHAVFKPINGVGPEKVDNLYSDVVMLRLATLPNVSFEIKTKLKQWIPGMRLSPKLQ